MLGAPPRAHAASLATREIIKRAAAAKTFFCDIFISVSSKADASKADIVLAAFKGNLGAETFGSDVLTWTALTAETQSRRWQACALAVACRS